jgi:tRNA-uridine 2-sulfurtransferase
MSGGVDSSVVAARVAAAGVRAFAITLELWPAARAAGDRNCCSQNGVDDAKRVAAELGLTHHVWNLEAEFDAEVIRDFEDEYAGGRTPNPCVRCNERVKFGLLLERAQAAGATHLATGHYARIGRRGDRRTLHRARDPRRDQSYVLHRLDQRQLASAIFPLGEARAKREVRAEAAARHLATAGKPDSQDLCIAGVSLRDELARRLAGRHRPGPLLDRTGRRVGAHAGLPFYTVGQRSGVAVAPDRPDAPPLYVLELRAADNSIVVGTREHLERRTLAAADCAWTNEPPAPGTPCAAQVRSHGGEHACTVRSANASGRLEIEFVQPVEQIAPGQSVVLYRGDEVLGGGLIRASA